MYLTKSEAENLLDALSEYDEQICPKELADDEVGLNAERFENLMKRLTRYVYEPETQICGVDCDCENETFEDFAISRLSEKDIINWSKNNE